MRTSARCAGAELVARPLIETRAKRIVGKDVPAWLPTEESIPGDSDVRMGG